LVLSALVSRATAISAPPISVDSAPKPIRLKPLVASAAGVASTPGRAIAARRARGFATRRASRASPARMVLGIAVALPVS